MTRRSGRRLAVLASLLACWLRRAAAAATTSQARRRPRRRPQGLRGRRHGRVAREGHAAHRPGPQLQRLRRGQGGWLRGRARAAQVLGRGHAAAGRRLARRGGRRARSRSCGRPRPARGARSSTRSGATRTSPTSRRRRSRSCSRRSSSPCPGRWRRRSAGPTRRSATPTSSPSPRTRTGGAPRATPNGARSSSARPTPTSRPARCRRRSPSTTRPRGKTSGPVARGPRPPRGRRVRRGRRVVGRALRRHHADVPQQPVPQRPAGRVAHLRLGGGRRGEVGHRLQPGQPRRHPRPGRGAAAAARAARGRLPEGRHALLRQPVLRARRAWVSPARSEARPRLRGVRAAAREPAAGARVRVPAGQPAGARSARRSTPPTASTPNQPQTRSACPSRRCSCGSSSGGREQRKAARVLLVIDVSGSMGEDAGDSGETKLDLAKRAAGRRPRPVQGRRRGRPAHLLHRASPRPSRPTTSTWCRSGRIGDNREAIDVDASDEPRARRRARRSTRSRRRRTTTMRENFDPAAHQRGRAAHRRPERGRPQQRPQRPADHAAVDATRASRRVRCASSRSPTAGDADLGVLQRIAEATNAAAYDASDPTTINQVFTAVITNF